MTRILAVPPLLALVAPCLLGLAILMALGVSGVPLGASVFAAAVAFGLHLEHRAWLRRERARREALVRAD